MRRNGEHKLQNVRKHERGLSWKKKDDTMFADKRCAL